MVVTKSTEVRAIQRPCSLRLLGCSRMHGPTRGRFFLLPLAPDSSMGVFNSNSSGYDSRSMELSKNYSPPEKTNNTPTSVFGKRVVKSPMLSDRSRVFAGRCLVARNKNLADKKTLIKRRNPYRAFDFCGKAPPLAVYTHTLALNASCGNPTPRSGVPLVGNLHSCHSNHPVQSIQIQMQTWNRFLRSFPPSFFSQTTPSPCRAISRKAGSLATIKRVQLLLFLEPACGRAQSFKHQNCSAVPRGTAFDIL